MDNLKRLFLLVFNPNTHEQIWSCHFNEKEVDDESSTYEQHGYTEIARFNGEITKEHDRLLEFGSSSVD
jgi:hypothetical protein